MWINFLLAILGFTKTNIVSEVAQLFARSIFTYISIKYTDESKGPWIFLAFAAFSVAEPIRYPYYFLKTTGYDQTFLGKFFGHLRYNFFIIFYPIGAFSDLMTGYYSHNSIVENGKYSLMLPNSYNISFYYPWFIGYFVPISYILMFPINYGYLLR